MIRPLAGQNRLMRLLLDASLQPAGSGLSRLSGLQGKDNPK